jgi:hypothetical protein
MFCRSRRILLRHNGGLRKQPGSPCLVLFFVFPEYPPWKFPDNAEANTRKCSGLGNPF